MRSLVIVVIVLLVAVSPSGGQKNPIPVNFEDAAVIIERWNADGAVKTHGTGFFYHDTASGPPFLVSNNHIFVGQDSLQVRFNNIDGVSETYTLTLIDDSGNTSWTAHPDTNVDLAVLQVPSNFRIRVIDSPRLKPVSEISLGDVVYFIGFPLTESTTDEKVYPLLRHGVVSYVVKEEFSVGGPKVYPKGTILIDATSLGGNSGGPVISSPRAGTSENSFIGVIQGHISIGQKAENADLGIVVPAECIPEAIAQYQME